MGQFCGALLIIGMMLIAVPPDGPSGAGVLIFPAMVLIYVTVGLVAWDRRPSSLMGPLLLGAAAALVLASLGNSANATIATVGAICATLPLATLIHLLLAFPTGRLPSRAERAVVLTGYLTSTLLQIPVVIWGPGGGFGVAPNREWAELGELVQSIVGAVAFAATVVVLTARIRRASSSERRVLAPLFVFGVASIAILLIGAEVLPSVFGWTPAAVGYLQLSVLALVPVAIALAALRGGIARASELEELGVWLTHLSTERETLAAVLSEALGDPSLELWFWDPHTQHYVDSAGQPVESQTAHPQRSLIPVDLDEEPVGALVYQRSLISDPESVRMASRMLGIVLDRERLTVLLRASRVDLQRSRERLVGVADTERRRIAQNLHDGLQAELVLLGIEAQQLAHAAADQHHIQERAQELRRSIDRSAAGLRALVHDVMPPSLMQRGLLAAAEDLVDRMPIPIKVELQVQDRAFPSAVESTLYFVLAEAITNVVKHAEAKEGAVSVAHRGSIVTLEITDDGKGGAALGAGSGLTGMAERIDVLGGVLTIDSLRGIGTRIRAEVPLA